MDIPCCAFGFAHSVSTELRRYNIDDTDNPTEDLGHPHAYFIAALFRLFKLVHTKLDPRSIPTGIDRAERGVLNKGFRVFYYAPRI